MTAAIEKKRAILAKIESVYGTDPSATGAANAVLARITGWRPQEVVYAGREDIAIPALGRFASKTSVQRAEIDLEIEITGASAAGTAPPYGPILRACGLAETVGSPPDNCIYAPISASHESAAIYANIDGIQQKLLGVRGSVALVFRNDELPFYRFRGVGLYALPTDTSLPTLTLSAHQAPVPVNRTNSTITSLHSYTVGIQELEVDMGNDVQYVDFPNGTQAVLIVNRAPSGRITIEHPTLAQKDYHSIVTSGATGTLQVRHTGGAAGKVLTLTASQVRLTNPQVGAVKGVRTLALGLEFAPSNSFNDEFSITYS